MLFLFIAAVVAVSKAASAEEAWTCIQTECNRNYVACSNQTTCRAAIACDGSCRTQFATATKRGECSDTCMSNLFRADRNAEILWNDLTMCYSSRCSQLAGEDNCLGYTPSSACQQISGCYFSEVSGTCLYEDPFPPTFSGCPLNIAETTSELTSFNKVFWPEIFALDNDVAAAVVLTRGFASGSQFPLGVTVVEFQASDALGNTATCSFNVTITDIFPPVISNCPADIVVDLQPEDVVLDPSGQARTVVSWAPPSVSDNVAATWVGPSPLTPSGTFPVGETVVIYEASDAAGNTASCSFLIVVPPTGLSYFTATNKRVMRKAFTRNTGFKVVFPALVDREACADRCLAPTNPFPCVAFLSDRSGVGACILLSFSTSSANPLVFDNNWDYFERQPTSAQTCPGQMDAEQCFNTMAAAYDTDPTACSDLLDAYQACTAAALLSCTNPDVMLVHNIRVAAAEALCADQPITPQSFPAARDLSCAGPWTDFNMCLDCVDKGYLAAVGECKVVNVVDGVLPTGDPACLLARHTKRTAATNPCIVSRPFQTTAPGSAASAANVAPLHTPGIPPTSYIDVAFTFQVAGVSVNDADSVFQASLLTGLVSVYGFDINYLEITSITAAGANAVSVVISIRAREDFPLLVLQNAARKRREVIESNPEEAFDVESPLYVLTTDHAVRSRRSTSLLSFVGNSALVSAYATSLVEYLVQNGAFPTGASLTSGIATPEYSAATALLMATTTTTTADPLATTTQTTTNTGTTGGSSTSTTSTPSTTTTTTTTTTQSTPSPLGSSSTANLSTNVMIVVIICVVFLLVVILVLLYAYIQSQANKKLAISAGLRTMGAQQNMQQGGGAPGKVVPGPFVVPGGATMLPPIRGPVMTNNQYAPLAAPPPTTLPSMPGSRGGALPDPFGRGNAVAPIL